MNWLGTIFILATAYVAVFLEASIDLPRRWLGAHLSLLPALMVYASLSRTIGAVALLAVCGGLWLDSLSANPLGVSILPLFLIGFILLQKRDLLLRESPAAQLALGLAAGAFFQLGTLFLLLNLGVSPLLGWMFLWQLLAASLAGGFLTPVCFALLDRLCRAFEYPPLNQTSFRADREIKRGRN